MADTDFDACFREHYPRLVALGVSMSGSREVARELAQETMLRAHDRWGEVGTYDHPGGWLRAVMSNLLVDHHRRRVAERSAIERIPEPTGDVAIGEHSPDDWWQLVAPLPPRQRIVVTLFYGEDLSIDEIAASLGIASGTVKSTLAKARRRLHDQLAAERGEHDHG